MSYQLYRNTTLGATLQESLDELMQLQMLSPALALRVLIQFDKSINNALATRVKNKLHFKADKLNTYRFCDNVWTFMLKEVEFRENSELAKVDRVKIVACDAKCNPYSDCDTNGTADEDANADCPTKCTDMKVPCDIF